MRHPWILKTTAHALAFLGVAVCLCLAASLIGFQSPVAGSSTEISLTPAVGPPTARVKVHGMGFGPREMVDVFFHDSFVATGRTDRAGSFSKGFKVPAWAFPGPRKVEAKGRVSSLSGQASFLVRTNWAQFRWGSGHVGFNRFENVLDVTTVRGMKLAWTASTGDFVESSPAVSDGRVFVGSYDKKLYAFDVSTGEMLWAAATDNWIRSSPAVVGGVVYVASDDSKVYAFEASTGVPVWSAKTGGNIESSPAVANGVVYVGSHDRNLYALDASTGAVMWSRATG